MIGVLMAALAGLLMSWYYRVGLVILSCAAFLIAVILRVLWKSGLELSDILILFAYLAALQGGFLLGAYFKHRSPDGDGS